MCSCRPRYGALHWLCVLLLLAPFCVGLGYLYPQGDDFDFATRCAMPFDIASGLYEPLRQWVAFSGRYFYHFMAVFLGKATTMPTFYALVCGAVLALHGAGMFGLLGLVRPALHQRDRLFCALLWVALLCCAYQNLPTFYMYTDVLSMGLQSALTMLFCASLGRLWQKTGTFKNCVLWAFVACGCYEHSAPAVVMTACVAVLLAWLGRKTEPQRLRNMLHVGGASVLFLCLSFLAPGNFVRSQTRGVDSTTKWQQLQATPHEWLDVVTSFAHSLWIPLVLLFLACVLLARGQKGEEPSRQPRHVALLPLLPVLLWIIFSVVITVLHSQSDVPLHTAPKLAAGINYYGALCLGWSLYLLANRMTIPDWLAQALPDFGNACRYLVICASFVIAWHGNLPPVLAQILVGNYQALGKILDERYAVLRESGLASDPNHDDKLGVVTRIMHPEVRKRSINPALPQMVVQRVMLPAVYPVHMGDAMPDNPEQWPNLWVAWLYGVGSASSALPDREAAIVTADSGRRNSMSLLVPTSWQEQGIEKAWLVQINGGHVGFDNIWLVLRLNEGKDWNKDLFLSAMRPHSDQWLKLFPDALSAALRNDIVNSQGDFGKLLFRASVAGFSPASWSTGRYCAVPLDPSITLYDYVAGVWASLHPTSKTALILEYLAAETLP